MTTSNDENGQEPFVNLNPLQLGLYITHLGLDYFAFDITVCVLSFTHLFSFINGSFSSNECL